MLALAALGLCGVLALPHREAVRAAAEPLGPAVGSDGPIEPPSPRIRQCLADGECALAVWSGVAGPAAMSFWILSDRWSTLTATDRQSLRRLLSGHLGRMRASPDAYTRGRWRDAWRSPDAQSGPPLAGQVRLASRSLVVLSPGRGADGALLHGRELHSF